jgi:hypothetical protein
MHYFIIPIGKNDFVYYETKVIDMNKVLTIRTQNLLINSTQFNYEVALRFPTRRDEDKHFNIGPGESIPFPESMKECKICLKTDEDKEFSNFIPSK